MNSPDPLLTPAFWTTAALTAIALPLGVFYGLLLLSPDARSASLPLSALGPLILVAVCLAHLSILSHARQDTLFEVRMWWLVLVALSGAATCIWFLLGIFSLHHGPTLILPVLFGIGALSNTVVCRLTLREWRSRIG